MSTTDQAICLRTTDWSETSQVVHLLTRQTGVVRLLAKGTKRAKSKSGGALDFFSEGGVVFAGAGREALGTLMEFVEEVIHTDIRADLRRLRIGLFMLELTSALLPEVDPYPEVFDLLHNALARLGQADASPPAVLAYFQYRLLRHVGLLGEVRSCIACGSTGVPVAAATTPELPYFSSSAGGLLCRNCEPAATEKMSAGEGGAAALATLAAAEAGRRVKLPDDWAEQANRLLAYHAEYQLGRRLKTARQALAYQRMTKPEARMTNE